MTRLVWKPLVTPLATETGQGHIPIIPASSTGRCNTICYKFSSKGGVYDATEAGKAFCGAKDRHVVPMEGGTVVA